MKNLSILLSALVVAPVAFAQGGPTASTATDFGVIAANATASDFDSVAQGTAIVRPLGVNAVVGGGGRHSRPDAGASSSVMPMMAPPGGPGGPRGPGGWMIAERGFAASADPAGAASAGTSADAPGAPSPTQAPHGVSFMIPAAQGANVTVSIAWDGRATQGAHVTASIDVDGDGTADWTGAAGTPDRQQLQVTAGANGVQVDVTTDGAAAVTGQGNESYMASLMLSFNAGGGGGGGVTCTWTPSGPQCQGQLAGSDSAGPRGSLNLQLDVTGAASGLGVLVVGDVLATPITLPNSTCQLLVDPSAGRLHAFLTDANGDATMTFRVPARPLTTNFQVVSIALTGGGSLGSTNALNLVCQ